MTVIEKLCRFTTRNYLKKTGLLHCHGSYTFHRPKCHIYTTGVRQAPVSLAYASYQMTNPQKMSKDPPVVILHGLLGSKMNWKSLGKAINVQTGRLVYTVDARNHGDSPHTEELSYSLMAEDLLSFLQERDCDKAVLMGHSMGGRTAMAAAMMEPSVVDKLIVLDISPICTSNSISDIPVFVEAMANIQVPPDLNMPQARAYVDDALSSVVTEKGVRQFLLTNLVHNGNKYSWRVNVDAIAKNFYPHIMSLTIPNNSCFEGDTAFIGGSLSDYLRPEEEDAIQEIFPSATFHYIEGAGHWLHADKPKEFLDILVPLLQN